MADKNIKEGRLCSTCNPFVRRTCQGYAYYEPREIRYCRSQMIFLIDVLDECLLDGSYPADPYVSGYEGGGFVSRRACAPYEMAEQLAGEVEVRLWTHGRTGEAGEALVDEIQNQHISHFNDFSRPAQRALTYISGFRRKLQTYPQWRANTYRKFVYVKNNSVPIVDKPVKKV